MDGMCVMPVCVCCMAGVKCSLIMVGWKSTRNEDLCVSEMLALQEKLVRIAYKQMMNMIFCQILRTYIAGCSPSQ